MTPEAELMHWVKVDAQRRIASGEDKAKVFAKFMKVAEAYRRFMRATNDLKRWDKEHPQ